MHSDDSKWFVIYTRIDKIVAHANPHYDIKLICKANV